MSELSYETVEELWIKLWMKLRPKLEMTKNDVKFTR
jgi:hypothetical protein